MPMLINVRHLEKGFLHCAGEVSAAELALEDLDEVLRTHEPMAYDLSVERSAAGLLVKGGIRLTFEADCVRCLKKFPLEVRIDDWQCLLALEGEEKVAVTDDCVDLTPLVREDILLALPQHPLCDPGCGGMLQAPASQADSPTSSTQGDSSSAWDALNKLQF